MKVFIRTSIVLMVCLFYSFPLRASLPPPDLNVEKFIDVQMAALKFPLSFVGNVNASLLKGQAAQQFKLWTDSNGNPQIHSLDNNGQALWAIVAGSASIELGGKFVNFIAVFSASDGTLFADGICPPNPIQWSTDLSLSSIPAPAPYEPKLESVQASQTADFFISQYQAMFDEVSIENTTYSGSDATGNPMKMSWDVQPSSNGKSLSVNFSSSNKDTASFVLNTSSQIKSSNFSQYDRDNEGNYLVIQTQDTRGNLSTLWVHTFEGNTIIRIGTGRKISEFDFNIDK